MAKFNNLASFGDPEAKFVAQTVETITFKGHQIKRQVGVRSIHDGMVLYDIMDENDQHPTKCCYAEQTVFEARYPSILNA